MILRIVRSFDRIFRAHDFKNPRQFHLVIARSPRWKPLVHAGKFSFSPWMDFLPRHAFNACVRRYGGDRRPRGFSCRDQFLAMALAQLTFRESLRDIETCRRAHAAKLDHAGFRSDIRRRALADANRTHDGRIFADFTRALIRRARELHVNEPLAAELDQTVRALDSATLDLCRSLFPRARFRRANGAVKRRTRLDLRGNIPCLIHVPTGKTPDVKGLGRRPAEAGAFCVMGRGDVDFKRLHRFEAGKAFFVTRAKRTLDFKRRPRRLVGPATGLKSDTTIAVAGVATAKFSPEPRRRVAFKDPETERQFVFLTNNVDLPARTVAMLCRSRWQVELLSTGSNKICGSSGFMATTRTP